MPSQQVRFQQVFPASQADVFGYFADHENVGRIWAGRARRIKEGQDPAEPNGLGSVRAVAGTGPTFEETILVFERPRRIEYAISRGSPFRNHRGVIVFDEAAGGTKVEYAIAFDPKIPLTGGLFARWLAFTWKRGAKRAAADISTAAGGGGFSGP